MIWEPITVALKNGQSVTLRPAEPEDAEAVLVQMRQTSGETRFLARYADEISISVESERTFIRRINGDPDEFFMVAVTDGCLVGTAGVTRVAPYEKMRHRAAFGISVLQSHWGVGIGSAMLGKAVALAKNTHFTQLELGVFADNERAVRLYEKHGFVAWGRQPNAFRLRDGSLRDEIQMVFVF